MDARTLNGMAYFYANTDRYDLEDAGIIQKGTSGDTAWNRFNHNFDIFILKLSVEKQEALASMMTAYLARFGEAVLTEKEKA